MTTRNRKEHWPVRGLAAAWLAAAGAGLVAAPAEVNLWETNLVIPTYRAAPPDPNPRFYQGRTYQGARATFYPYPVSDRLTGAREDQTYRAVFLENQYIQLSVLPELGGRILSAVDKSNQYDFFYRQHVIKPALIGMLGAWISGGVEWNVPHHHRASSFMPVDYALESHADGSKTLWVGEIELRHRLKWSVGLTLHPGRSYIEMSARLANRTPFAHSFLFWINPAVHANTNYQVVFPPRTAFAVQHGKPEFVHWPIAHTTYAGVDYSRGVDISWWKNHPSPCSFFAWNSEEDFFGGYDHGRQAGVIHYADHHVVPGKKFFEWGVGPEGQMWSRILTDADGPYLELMAGAYSDNQPDYSWIQPGEVKTWKHYWYPVREIGAVKNATLDAAVNLEYANRTLRVAFNATAQFTNAQARVTLADKVLLDKHITISPAQPFASVSMVEAELKPERLCASLRAANGRELVAYQPAPPPPNAPLPEPVRRPPPPKEIKSNEELYLTGLRIEQLYSPSFEAAPYYEEALRRDPGDYRANTALGILHCKAWRWPEAEARLRAAIARATANYIRPKDGEAFYYLGVALRGQGRLNEAHDAFYPAIWSLAWQAAAYQALAEIDCRRGEFARALANLDRSLAASAANPKARNLKAAVLRRMDRADEAAKLAADTLAADPLDLRAAAELFLAQRQLGQTDEAASTARTVRRLLRGEVQSCLEVACDYGNAGLWAEAIEGLQAMVAMAPDQARVFPLLHYYLAYYNEEQARSGADGTIAPAAAAEAARLGLLAAQMPPDFCFPLRFEEEPILRRAMERNPQDARAPYYLGNLLYDNQPAKAIAAWERARDLDGSFALAHRNLALAYAQTQGDVPKAIASLEKAVSLNPKEPRFFYELDVLYEAGGAPVQRRLETLARNREIVAQRDDALTRLIVLYTVAGQPGDALDVLQHRRFHNWEGRGEIHGIYVDALLRRGMASALAGKHAEALRDYEAALDYPANLEVGRPYRDRKAPQIHYFIATAHAALGDQAKARAALELAVAQKETSPSEVQYYQALALQKLGQKDDANRIFTGLVKHGASQLQAGEAADYFAKFGERQSERARKAQAHYLAGLGHLGLGQKAEAKAQFTQALEQNPGHLGATIQLALPE